MPEIFDINVTAKYTDIPVTCPVTGEQKSIRVYGAFSNDEFHGRTVAGECAKSHPECTACQARARQRYAELLKTDPSFEASLRTL